MPCLPSLAPPRPPAPGPALRPPRGPGGLLPRRPPQPLGAIFSHARPPEATAAFSHPRRGPPPRQPPTRSAPPPSPARPYRNARSATSSRLQAEPRARPFHRGSRRCDCAPRPDGRTGGGGGRGGGWAGLRSLGNAGRGETIALLGRGQVSRERRQAGCACAPRSWAEAGAVGARPRLPSAAAGGGGWSRLPRRPRVRGGRRLRAAPGAHVVSEVPHGPGQLRLAHSQPRLRAPARKEGPAVERGGRGDENYLFQSSSPTGDQSLSLWPC